MTLCIFYSGIEVHQSFLTEPFLVAAYQVSSLLENHNYDLKEAMNKVIHEKIGAIGGDGGMIGIDKNSDISMEFNTSGMYRAYVNKYGEKEIFLYEE